MTHPYRGNDDRQMSGEGEVDEEAEHEAEEHAEDVRREDPGAIADEDADDDETPPVAPV
ncbi:hypothetical protein [Phytomonospora endophytica]|uniref:Uncharacterized protein n=1 Tax=Phytomonospora endophytica TaxID=714109 RepID=A0A841FDP3_9ACTN|nr:hypothetical protein [Phytomonospora endophytica]MBB6033934.1 hypothetical protein [Phytomonospora endophytica]GIG64545.1 hypothetical protein Pen01_08400 [Phytomonospora endophytica]